MPEYGRYEDNFTLRDTVKKFPDLYRMGDSLHCSRTDIYRDLLDENYFNEEEAV